MESGPHMVGESPAYTGTDDCSEVESYHNAETISIGGKDPRRIIRVGKVSGCIGGGNPELADPDDRALSAKSVTWFGASSAKTQRGAHPESRPDCCSWAKISPLRLLYCSHSHVSRPVSLRRSPSQAATGRSLQHYHESLCRMGCPAHHWRLPVRRSTAFPESRSRRHLR